MQLGLDVRAAPAPKVKEVVDEVEITPMEAAENADEALEEELSRLTAAEAAKRQRERRKKNALKAREQLKLQLNMTTPMDIGMEAHAPGEDMFNLNLVDGKKVPNSQTLLSDSEDDEAEFKIDPREEEENESDADLDDEERRIKQLEANLDEMYDAYQNAKLERDTKARAREARRKKRQEEGGEWAGIGQNSDSDDAEDSEPDNEVQPDSTPESDSDSDSDSEAESTAAPRSNKRLLTDLKDPAKSKKRKLDEKDRAAAVWYDQAVFKGVPGLDELLNEGEEDEDQEEEADLGSEGDEVMSSDEQLPGKIKTKGLFEPQEVFHPYLKLCHSQQSHLTVFTAGC